ncbi:PP2C family protein-serine/threonine phosphatase [Sorangium atrum]|uniref:Protein phosphatase 2C domain-containing protein n=1 Tax=Sorangium atrum TaxID=2995308 RepID=A0ABT5CEZ1_9BACT|nr:protein phosphatase 2C domain-containing protein [Sorangium aterium]MDC0684359.1 protein phosphatase 2C domain-containing protein [Sorangium aterium]
MYPQLAIEAAAHSDVGRRRSHNEDSFAALPCLGLFMVADGLGGNAAGEVASRMAIEVVKSCFEVAEDLEETWPYGTGSSHDRDEVRLVMSVRRANRAIYDASQRQERTRGMATTFAGVLLGAGMAYIAHVGDTRVYRMRGGKLERLTRDHTLLEELLHGGESARAQGTERARGRGDPSSRVRQERGDRVARRADPTGRRLPRLLRRAVGPCARGAD